MRRKLAREIRALREEIAGLIAGLIEESVIDVPGHEITVVAYHATLEQRDRLLEAVEHAVEPFLGTLDIGVLSAPIDQDLRWAARQARGASGG